MAKLAKEMSPLEVGRLSAEGTYAVGGVSGLQLQIIGGSRAWILRVVIGGKRRRMGLGPFPEVKLAAARDAAREALSRIRAGGDPILERQQAGSARRAEQAKALTFEQAARKFVEIKGDEWRNPKHRAQWLATLEAYVFPIMGRLLVSHVEQGHVLQALTPIWKTKTETASRVRGRIEQVLDWATASKLRAGENPARWRGHLDKLLPKPGKVAKVEHHAAVDLNALPGFISTLRIQQGMGAKALEFAILTAARSGEVRGATWSEIDMDGAMWVVPASRMKAGREHRVPLSGAALSLLRALPRVEGVDYVFPAPRGGKLSDMTLSAVMRRMKVPAVPHGFRSTFRDWASERTNYPSEMAEMALAHTIDDKVEAAYRRGDMFAKRLHMMEAWAKFCDAPPTCGEVVPIRAAGAAHRGAH